MKARSAARTRRKRIRKSVEGGDGGRIERGTDVASRDGIYAVAEELPLLEHGDVRLVELFESRLGKWLRGAKLARAERRERPAERREMSLDSSKPFLERYRREEARALDLEAGLRRDSSGIRKDPAHESESSVGEFDRICHEDLRQYTIHSRRLMKMTPLLLLFFQAAPPERTLDEAAAAFAKGDV